MQEMLKTRLCIVHIHFQVLPTLKIVNFSYKKTGGETPGF